MNDPMNSLKTANSKIRYATTLGVVFACLAAQAHAKENREYESPMIALAKEEQRAEKPDKSQRTFSGNVSWYGPGFHGRKTASGELFDMNKLTAAHLTLPFGTRVLVEDPRTGNTVIVRVNDRGPYVRTRVMDLSREGARKLGTLERGKAFVDCLVLEADGK